MGHNIFLVVLIALITRTSGTDHEKRLLSNLFEKYKADLRPVASPHDTVKISLGISLLQIQKVNMKRQALTSSVWIRMTWNDVSLQWDENQYGNVSVLRVRPEMVWLPDLVLLNSNDDDDGLHTVPKLTNVLVYSSGQVLWVASALFKTSCTVDPTYFPLDQQTCVLKFKSASYNGRELSWSLYGDKFHADLSDYWKNDQWAVVEVPAYHWVSSTDEQEQEVTFYFTIRRKLEGHTVMLLVLSILLASVTVFPFILPPKDEKPERLILQLGGFSGAIIVMVHLHQTFNPLYRTKIPILTKYLLQIVFLNFLSIAWTIAAICVTASNTPMPNLLQKFVEGHPGKMLTWGRNPSSNPPSNKENWKLLTVIMDRALFAIYLLLVVICTGNLALSGSGSTDFEDSVIGNNKNLFH